MANYEIMLVVSGSLKDSEAKKVANEVASSISECKPKVTEYGPKQLAYKIKKDDTGYYFQYNFECESPLMINEFRRLASINKYVLRSLIINLEKDYGYRASVNPKKIARNKKTFEIHQERKQKIEEAKALKNGEKINKNVEATANVNVNNEAAEATTKKPAAKKAKANDIPNDKKHDVVSLADFSEYNYNKRRKEWHEKAGHNEKQLVCSICKDDDNWETILLEDGRHICYYCWIKKPESSKDMVKAASTTTKKTTTKSTKAKK